MKFLWVTDPWTTLDHSRDTTLRLIDESCRAGVENHWCDGHSIRWDGKEVVLDARVALGSGKFSDETIVRPSEFSHIFYRTDPPVDSAYLFPLQLLELGIRGKRTLILNPPAVLLGSSEKTEFFPLKNLTPLSVVASETEVLMSFLRKEGRAVLKPLNSAQSKGVQVLQASDVDQSMTAIQAMTRGGQVPVMLQEYLPGIAQGEVRLWFAGGKLVAHARKLPKKGEAVIDMDRGGEVVATRLNAREKRASLQIGAHLRKRGIIWAAVDLIDGKLTDFNFTSPGLLVQLEKIMGKNLAKLLLAAIPSTRKSRR